MNTELAPYEPKRTLVTRANRKMTGWYSPRRLKHAPRRTIVSFTFDDFPKSAADTGAEILESAGGFGCYYAATGMAGTHNHSGQQFDERDIEALQAAGHEIGAHTRSHMDCARTAVEPALRDIETNLRELSEMGVREPVRQFAWPYGETRIGLKTRINAYFDCARGIRAGVSGKGSDLAQLAALELGDESWTTDRAAAAIEAGAGKPAWIVLFTHDVSNKPSQFGTRPADLTRLVRLARDTGAAVLTPSQALDEINGVEAVQP